MKKRGFAFLLTLMLILPMTFAAAADNTALTTEIDTYLKRYKTAGAAVLVAKDGETVYTRYYGYAKKKTEEKISSQTYFRIASVSKLVSGIHVMQLVEQGLLDLDTDISEYLGYKVQNPYYPDNPLTLRMIMSHTTSLKSNGGYTKIQLGLRELISADKPHRGNYYREKPGSKYRYSNFGAGIMGSLIESVTGKNLNDSITESLFGPLNMDAAYSPSLLKYPANVPVIYKPGGGGSVHRRRLGRKGESGQAFPHYLGGRLDQGRGYDAAGEDALRRRRAGGPADPAAGDGGHDDVRAEGPGRRNRGHALRPVPLSGGRPGAREDALRPPGHERRDSGQRLF